MAGLKRVDAQQRKAAKAASPEEAALAAAAALSRPPRQQPDPGLRPYVSHRRREPGA